MSRPDDTTIPWPVGREYHSSCLLAGPLTGHHHPLVVVVGGRDNNVHTLSDLWIMMREQTWKVCLGLMTCTCGVCRNVLWLLSDSVSHRQYYNVHGHVGYTMKQVFIYHISFSGLLS